MLQQYEHQESLISPRLGYTTIVTRRPSQYRGRAPSRITVPTIASQCDTPNHRRPIPRSETQIPVCTRSDSESRRESLSLFYIKFPNTEPNELLLLEQGAGIGVYAGTEIMQHTNVLGNRTMGPPPAVIPKDDSM